MTESLKGSRTYIAIATFIVGAIVKKTGIPGLDGAVTQEIVGFVADGLQVVGAGAATYFRSKATQPVDKQSEKPIAAPKP